MKKLLIIRFSALGDVAMAVPVVQALATQYPELDITVLSQQTCSPLFARLPMNVHFVGADIKDKHKNLKALKGLLLDMDYKSFDYVADFHSVIRSHYVRLLCWLLGKKVAVIDKGYAQKRTLTRRSHKILRELPTSIERYSMVLSRLGFPVIPNFISIFDDKPQSQHWVGIAPFARHQGKIYPLEKMEKVVEQLSQKGCVTTYLFGFGEREQQVFDHWCTKYPNTVSLAGRHRIDGELAIMNQLDVMVSMDSANMHLASLVHTPVVSVWGATHPYAGFMGWRQSMDNAVQLDLSCRPCSVFGNKPCWRGDYACLHGITPDMIVEKIEANLQ